MVKTKTSLDKKYPDLEWLFAAKEAARKERAKEPPSAKFRTVMKLNEVTAALKTARTVKRSGIKRG